MPGWLGTSRAELEFDEMGDADSDSKVSRELSRAYPEACALAAREAGINNLRPGLDVGASVVLRSLDVWLEWLEALPLARIARR